MLIMSAGSGVYLACQAEKSVLRKRTLIAYEHLLAIEHEHRHCSRRSNKDWQTAASYQVR